MSESIPDLELIEIEKRLDGFAKSELARHVSSQMIDGLVRYVGCGVLPDSFLSAVLENDLVAAFELADDQNKAAMKYWAELLRSEIPRAAWGNAENVEQWCRTGGLLGRRLIGR